MIHLYIKCKIVIKYKLLFHPQAKIFGNKSFHLYCQFRLVTFLNKNKYLSIYIIKTNYNYYLFDPIS